MVCLCGVCLCVFVCVFVCGTRCVLCILQGRVWVCDCVDFFTVHKQAWHAGRARCIFEKCVCLCVYVCVVLGVVCIFARVGVDV